MWALIHLALASTGCVAWRGRRTRRRSISRARARTERRNEPKAAHQCDERCWLRWRWLKASRMGTTDVSVSLARATASESMSLLVTEVMEAQRRWECGDACLYVRLATGDVGSWLLSGEFLIMDQRQSVLVLAASDDDVESVTFFLIGCWRRITSI